MGQYLYVSLGGALGALVRYLLGSWIAGRYGPTFPLHTFTINVTGSFAIGVLLTLLTVHVEASPAWRLLLVVGFLGGYTTFSSYTFEALTLLRDGEWGRAAWYVLGSNALGLAACFAGMIAANALALIVVTRR